MIRTPWTLALLVFWCFLVGGVGACEDGGGAVPAWKSVKCDGYEALCDHPYNEVAYAETHNFDGERG